MQPENTTEDAGFGFDAIVEPMNFKKRDESASTKTDIAKMATILDNPRAIVECSERRRRRKN